MNKGKKAVMTMGIWLILLTWMLSGCNAGAGSQTGAGGRKGDLTLVDEDETYEKEEDSQAYEAFTDKASCYEGEEDPEVVVMYLTVGRGNEKDGTDHTWTEVNQYPLSWYEENGVKPYQCEAVLQEGDETGPVKDGFGFKELVPNATVALRGSNASEHPQKSYRIDIKEGKGRWEEQKAVVLNKHVTDPVRFKNRLAYSLMQDIPYMFSARTRFVHLYVKDKTEGKDGLFKDYGLYTAVEQINKSYLKHHGLDNGGQLYQAEEFDWGLHADSIQLATSPSYNEKNFEQYLEIKGDVDHTKLITMLQAVNSEEMTGSQILDQYFDRNNLYYWMAFHMLMGNTDVSDSNYYLYSPLGSDKWYLFSWNNADVLSEYYKETRDESYSRSWNHGIFTYVNAVLYKKILSDDRCREEFDRVVTDVKENYLTREKIEQKTEEYAAVVKPYLYELPDRLYARVTQEEYDIIASRMAEEVNENYQGYLDSLKEPWPFHILEPEKAGDMLLLKWEEAYCHQGSTVYTVELARSYDFENCLVLESGIEGTEFKTAMPGEGQYFLRVRAEGPGEAFQDAYEYYHTEQGTTVYGTLCFYILQDGTIQASRYIGE